MTATRDVLAAIRKAEVIAYGRANLVAGRGVDVPWEQAPDNAAAPPALHAIVAGVSSYADPSISLRFPAKDALDMAHALELGGKRMFGVERTDIALFATGTGREPTKENIRKAFETIPAKAGPSDVVLVYGGPLRCQLLGPLAALHEHLLHRGLRHRRVS